MDKKQRNYDCSRKEVAEIELIQAKIAESRSKSVRNYCAAAGIFVMAGIKFYFGG